MAKEKLEYWGTFQPKYNYSVRIYLAIVERITDLCCRCSAVLSTRIGKQNDKIWSSMQADLLNPLAQL